MRTITGLRFKLGKGFREVTLGIKLGTSRLKYRDDRKRNGLPKGRYVAKLAGALGIDAAALLGDSPRDIDELAEEVRLLAAFRVLSKDRQLIAIRLLEALK